MYSIIMPIYNGERYLKESVSSVLRQTDPDFELILVDDGSSDGSFELCRVFAEKDSRVRLFRKENGGVSSARNFGVAQAKGLQILFIDCDDAWDPDLLALCRAQGTENTVLFGMREDFYDRDGTIVRQAHEGNDDGSCGTVPVDSSLESIFLQYNFASPCNKVYQKQIIDAYRLSFSERCVYLEDLKFNLDYFSHASSFRMLRRSLYHYRLLDGQNQMLKRNFRVPFVNADELFASAEAFSVQRWRKSCLLSPVLVSVLNKAYLDEMKYYRNTGRFSETFPALRFNEHYRQILAAAPGKRNRLFRTAIRWNLKPMFLSLLEQ